MDWRFLRNVSLKALGLFIAVNFIFAALNPVPALAHLSAYNALWPGRLRLPYGERPEAYNLSLFSLEAMFAAHLIAGGDKPADEFRVVLIGDSSTWGFLLRPDETRSALLNAAGLHVPGDTASNGRLVQVYNLGYPTMSLTKDLMILEQAMQHQPDLIIWFFTLESFPLDKQLASPLVQHNAAAARGLIEAYHLPLPTDDPALVTPTFWDQTLIGQRRALADLFRLQLYGLMWSVTGVDQFYPPSYDPPQWDLSDDMSFHTLQPPALDPTDLAFEVLDAAAELAAAADLAAEMPILFVNEPIFISQGQNSDLRYNFFYPRWAYDQYRAQLAQRAQANGWRYLDLWDRLPASAFSNSAIHLTPQGEKLLVDILRIEIETTPQNFSRGDGDK